MAELIERLKDYVVSVNSYPFLKKETIDRKNGIVRVYGLDGDLQKINYVVYPKKNYTRKYIEDNILHKYDHCPLCNVGTEVNADKRKPVIKLQKTEEISEIGKTEKTIIPDIIKKSVGKKIGMNKKGVAVGVVAGLTAIPLGIFLIRLLLKRNKT